MFNIDILSPGKLSQDNFSNFVNVNPLGPFSDIIVTFLDDLSASLRKIPHLRDYPEIATFAFFCRKANILGYKKVYETNIETMLGRGLVFHIAPSNVPLNFAYSLVSSLLAGNSNIVRVPTKDFEQVDIIITVINKLLENKYYKVLKDRILLVKYPRKESNITEYFSSVCDVRIIWGGDQTINEVRKFPLSPQSFDITFADRTSVVLLNSESILALDSLTNLVQSFYNDTYLNDQNACTSPFMVIWYGKNKNIEKSKDLFWKELQSLIDKKYEMNDISSVDKLATFMQHSIDKEGNISLFKDDNKLWRVIINEYNEDLLNYKCNSGYFIEFNTCSLDNIIFNFPKKIQTLSYFGFNKDILMRIFNEKRPNGIDRLVPVGRTQDFTLKWDGYDLISILTKNISIY